MSCASGCPRPRCCSWAFFPEAAKPDSTRDKLEEVNRQISRLDDGTNVSGASVGKLPSLPNRKPNVGDFVDR